MRRTLFALSAAALAAAALALPAAAKEMAVSLAAGPPSVDPGQPWNAQLLVHGEPAILAEASPGIQIRGPGGEERTFTAKATGKRAPDGQLLYRARVVFPTEGRWSYLLLDGVTDRAYEGGTLLVGDAPAATPTPAPEAPAPAATPQEDGFPLWPVLAAALATAAAAAAAIALVRRSRIAATR